MRSRTPTNGPARNCRPAHNVAARASARMASPDPESPSGSSRSVVLPNRRPTPLLDDYTCLREGGDSRNDSLGRLKVLSRSSIEGADATGESLLAVRNYSEVHDLDDVVVAGKGGKGGNAGDGGTQGQDGQDGVAVENGRTLGGSDAEGSVTQTLHLTTSSSTGIPPETQYSSSGTTPPTTSHPPTLTVVSSLDSPPSTTPQPPRISTPTSTPQGIVPASRTVATFQFPTIASTDTLSFRAESSSRSTGVSGSVSTSASFSFSEAPSASSSSATATTPGSPATATVTTRTSGGHGPSSVLIIALSSVLAVCALVALALGYFLWRKHRRRRTERGGDDASSSSSSSPSISKGEYDESGPEKEDGKLLDPRGPSDPDTARVLSPSTEASSTLHITSDELSSTAADVGGMRLSAPAADSSRDAKGGGADELCSAAMPWERRRMDVGALGLGGHREGVREVEYEDEPPPYEPRARWP